MFLKYFWKNWMSSKCSESLYDKFVNFNPTLIFLSFYKHNLDTKELIDNQHSNY